MIRLLPAEPVLNVELAAQRTGRSEEAIRLALSRLEQAGVVQLTTVGKRNRVWESIGLFACVDDLERDLSGGERGASPTR